MKLTLEQCSSILATAAYLRQPVDCGDAVLNRGVDASGKPFAMYIDVQGVGYLFSIEAV